MHYRIHEQKLLDEPDWAALRGAAQVYEQRAAEETFSLVLAAFHLVSALERLTLTVTCDTVSGDGLRSPSYSCGCELELRAIPSVLALPRQGQRAPLTDFVADFLRRGEMGDEQFVRALSDYFEDIWPAFNDRSHLFGGTGRISVTRSQLLPLLARHTTVDLKVGVRALKSGGSYVAAVLDQPDFVDTVPGGLSARR
jgi:hypothetical protein